MPKESISKICSDDGCQDKATVRSLCKKHYMSLYHAGKIIKKTIPVTCTVDGCDNPHVAKGYCQNHYMMLRVYGRTYRIMNKQGSGHTRKDGYVITRHKLNHITIAERVIGKQLPKGAVVHHVDGKGTNNIGSNLVICPSQAYHMMIHARERALDECGHADWDRCCFCGKHDNSENLRKHKNGRTQHLSCRNKYDRDRRAELKSI